MALRGSRQVSNKAHLKLSWMNSIRARVAGDRRGPCCAKWRMNQRWHRRRAGVQWWQTGVWLEASAIAGDVHLSGGKANKTEAELFIWSSSTQSCRPIRSTLSQYGNIEWDFFRSLASPVRCVSANSISICIDSQVWCMFHFNSERGLGSRIERTSWADCRVSLLLLASYLAHSRRFNGSNPFGYNPSSFVIRLTHHLLQTIHKTGWELIS